MQIYNAKEVRLDGLVRYNLYFNGELIQEGLTNTECEDVFLAQDSPSVFYQEEYIFGETTRKTQLFGRINIKNQRRRLNRLLNL